MLFLKLYLPEFDRNNPKIVKIETCQGLKLWFSSCTIIASMFFTVWLCFTIFFTRVTKTSKELSIVRRHFAFLQKGKKIKPATAEYQTVHSNGSVSVKLIIYTHTKWFIILLQIEKPLKNLNTWTETIQHLSTHTLRNTISFLVTVRSDTRI